MLIFGMLVHSLSVDYGVFLRRFNKLDALLIGTRACCFANHFAWKYEWAPCYSIILYPPWNSSIFYELCNSDCTKNVDLDGHIWSI